MMLIPDPDKKDFSSVPFKLEQNIIFENDDFVVINKPSGLLSIPDREGKEVSLKTLLQNKYGIIFTVHRLDKGTSGLVVFARNEEMHKHLSQQFEQRVAKKYYAGLVLGSLAELSGSIDAPISEHPSRKGFMTVYKTGKPSLTDYEVVEDFGVFSWLQFQIHTGRTHQIRVHMKHLGHPIACDELYGDGKPILLSLLKKKYKLSKNDEEERPILNRLALHAQKLQFAGLQNELYEFEAPLPRDLAAVLYQLGKWRKRVKG